MNKITVLLFTCLLALSTGCKKSEKDASSSNLIIGKWHPVHTKYVEYKNGAQTRIKDEGDVAPGTYVRYLADGTGRSHYVVQSAFDYFKYSITADSLKISNTGNENVQEFHIVSLTSTSLILHYDTYHKIDDDNTETATYDYEYVRVNN